MPLETATYISDLNSANPAHSDQLNQADAHMRLIKAVLKAQFPNFTAAVLNSTQAQIDAVATAFGAGSLTFAVGAAATPSINFTGDTTTGLYHPAAGQVGVSLAGVLLALFSSAGLTLQSGDVNLISGAFKLNGTSIFPLQAANIGALQVGTAALAASGVTYAKIQNEAAVSLLGNPTGSPAAPSEITLGSGLAFSGTTLTAPAFPPQGARSNLSIKVATNTTITVAADYITVTDGSTFSTHAFSSTINMATTGANALDSGSIAAATWYTVWAIAKADGTTACLASASASAPTMPSGYTRKARIGWVRTAAGVAQLLGTWQLGNRAQYVVGLAQTSLMPTITSGNLGSTTTPTWVSASVSAIVPPTASAVHVCLFSSNVAVMAAPNNSYGARTSLTNPPPIVVSVTGNMVLNGSFMLESTNVYFASEGANAALLCSGWDDNI